MSFKVETLKVEALKAETWMLQGLFGSCVLICAISVGRMLLA